jgi:hypothetical protein
LPEADRHPQTAEAGAHDRDVKAASIRCGHVVSAVLTRRS